MHSAHLEVHSSYFRPEPDSVINLALDMASQPTQGIIMCLHEDIIALGVSLIRELRCLDNWEPIEVYHCSELSPATEELIYSIDNNVRVIDICAQLVNEGRFTDLADQDFQNYWIKPLAVHESNLSEIILLDADVLLLKNPALLRDVPSYQENGTVFFYDRVLPYRLFANRFGTENGSEFTFDPSISDQEIIQTSYAEDAGSDQVQYLRHWVEHFDYDRFNGSYGPSRHLLDSLIYAAETAHEQDSSIVLIDKARAERAMAVLWFLITDHRFRFRFSWYVPVRCELWGVLSVSYDCLLTIGATRRPSGCRSSSRTRPTPSRPGPPALCPPPRIGTWRCIQRRCAGVWPISCP